ncbi:MAG: M23 family metallopeptidase [Phenylobacterium sp.]
MSFQKIDISQEVEIPILPHVGSFGVARRYDIHKGVDLYCPEGTPIYAVEDGIFNKVAPWTGAKDNTPWREETDAVYIDGKSGVVAYGEIELRELSFEKGQGIKAGQLIGYVKRVLKKDKGRPMSMLHLRLYNHGVYGTGGVWEIGKNRPKGLLDPTSYLLNAEELTNE